MSRKMSTFLTTLKKKLRICRTFKIYIVLEMCVLEIACFRDSTKESPAFQCNMTLRQCLYVLYVTLRLCVVSAGIVHIVEGCFQQAFKCTVTVLLPF